MDADLVILLVLVVVGYTTGTIIERRHYRSIRRREAELVNLPAIPSKGGYDPEQVEESWLVVGNVVLTADYFKLIAGSFKNLFGGRLGWYETLLDRARREAVLRMKELATNASIIVNLRLETSAIGGEASERKRGGVRSVEVFAHGTAVRLRS